MKKFMTATAAVLLLCGIACALDDTPANRGTQADRYLVAMPVKETMTDMATNMSKNLPDEQKQVFKDLMANLDMSAVEKAMKKSLIKHFSADELKALADFYGSPVGKSAMKKFGPYMADVMPAIQTEMMKAHAKVQQHKEEGESKPDEPAPSEPKAGEPKPKK